MKITASTKYVTCIACGEKVLNDQTLDEALSDFERTFGSAAIDKAKTKNLKNLAIVCDGCFQEMMNGIPEKALDYKRKMH